MTTMWDHMYGYGNQYHCEYYIYLLSCLVLEFIIIIDRKVFAPGHGKDVVSGINDRYKQVIKL